jgi:biotin-(acetyl-CoA carboxylase) ligase
VHDRAALLGSLLFRLERIYDGWRHGGLADLYGELGARDFLRGRRITVDGEGATALQILRDGRLEIETDTGDVRVIESGEVRYAA